MDIKKKKGQAAMEYLMTYGWALLVIVIVLALLLVILGGYVQGTPSCLFEEAGFVCNEVTPIMDVNGSLYGKFQHAQNEPINLYRVGCVEGQVNKNDVNWIETVNLVGTPLEISPRASMKFGDLDMLPAALVGDGTPCYDASGVALTGLSPGSQVRGQLWIEYNYKSDASIGYTGKRTATATFVTNVG